MKSKKWLFGVLIIGIAIVCLSFLNIDSNLVYFYTPAEAVTKAAELNKGDIRVGGLVKAGSVQWNSSTLSLEFTLTDLKESNIEVSYKGSPPDMFKENQGVVVEGRINQSGKGMLAKKLFVKHSEEYKKPDDHTSMDAEYLQKSLFKDEQMGGGKQP